MQLADALSHCLARASQEIKLDMRVNYIAFMKPWIEKLKDSMQRDPILSDGVSTHIARLATSTKTCTTLSTEILGLQRRTINR